MGKQRLEMHQKRDNGTAQQKERRLELNVPQVAGSAIAAVAAAVLASQLGVYGTILGAGVVSVVATCGGSVFQHLFRRTGEQIREVTHQVRPKGGELPPRSNAWQEQGSAHGEFGEAATHGTRVRGWKRSLLAAAVVFAVAMIGITGYELASGQDLSGGRGTTVGTAVRGGGGGNSAPEESPSPAGPEENGGGGGERRTTPDGGSGDPDGNGNGSGSGTGSGGGSSTEQGAGTDGGADPGGSSGGSGSAPGTEGGRGDGGEDEPTPTPTPSASTDGGTPSEPPAPKPTPSPPTGADTP
ncbi:hypothetical protein [Streptomyces sp. NBC_00259]|uniref:hypothetical protein n=1 Tax=Streptomyces sp. NBC_00259 TaxID=2903643 RepID=UPI002E2C1A77|nr:hypothetical protein [Streptomyces sp. NBC_00259]